MRPDIVLLDVHWPRRALLRAQLIEEGYEVVATDEWPTARTYVQALLKPRLVIVDLQELADAEGVLDELQSRIQPGHVLVLTALGTAPPDELAKRGFHALPRPATVSDVVERAANLLKSSRKYSGGGELG
jgi:DNA-binding response OmpR family regulator